MAEALGIDIRKYPQSPFNYPPVSIRKEVAVRVGTISATTGVMSLVVAALTDIIILDIFVTTSTTLAADGTNYWAIDFQDRGSAGTGTDSLFSTAQDTQTTGFTANVPRQFTPDQNTRIAQGDAMAVTFTKAASAANLDDLTFVVVYRANA